MFRLNTKRYMRLILGVHKQVGVVGMISGFRLDVNEIFVILG